MNFDLRPLFAIWILLAATVGVLFVRRKMVASHEDDNLHVLDGAPVAQQATVAQKLDQIDRWGKIFTVIAVVFGLLVAAAYVYQVWVQSTQIPTGA
ncbi:MAG TPA: hypothetical protein VKU19_05815 [Bryobacteraceae bacterium]|nr:hypothetical protein [Bryobacteraceae bacterium]